MHRLSQVGEPDGIITVLYVDDEPALLDITKEFLELEGDIVVSVSSSVKKVLRDAASGRYDVILSDYRMPELDGLAFLKVLRENGADTPFVIFTGQGREEVIAEALNSGADFYMQKGGDPVLQFGELRNVIMQLAQRSRAEKALHEREEVLSLITDNMRDIVVRVDGENFVEYISPSVASTGWKAEEVVGRSIFDFIHPDDVERAVSEAGKAIARREGLTLEYRQLNKNGSYSWSEANGKYLFNDDGGMRTAVFSIRNVEDRKRFEEELRSNNRKCQSIIDYGNIIMLSMDQEGRVTWMNEFAQQFFGFSEEEIVGRPAVGTIVPKTEEGSGRDLCSMIGKMTLNANSFAANINQNMKKNGERVWVAWTNRNTDMGEGGNEVLCTGVDITERNRSVEALGESNAMLQSIIDSIPSAILVVSNDEAIKAYNHRFLDMWGLHDVYQNLPFSDLIEAIGPQLEDPDRFRSAYGHIMQSKGSSEQWTIGTRDGRQYRVYVKPHHLKGVAEGTVWTFLDYTS